MSKRWHNPLNYLFRSRFAAEDGEETGAPEAGRPVDNMVFSLRQGELPNVIQFLSMANRTGQLELVFPDDQRKGYIYFRNGEVIRDFVTRLGAHIKSCHAKDILLRDRLTVHLDEVQPGRGALDYRTFLTQLATLDPDVPLMLEHLSGPEEYAAAATHIRHVAEQVGVSV